MKKNLLALTVVLALTFALAACSTKPATDSAPSPAPVTTAATTAGTLTYTDPAGYTKTSVAGTTTFSNMDNFSFKTIIIMEVPGKASTDFDYAALSTDDATKLLSDVNGISDVVVAPITVDGVNGTKITYTSTDNNVTTNYISVMFVNDDKLTQITGTSKAEQAEDLQKDFDALIDSVKIAK